MHTFPTQPVSPRQTLDLLWTRIRQRGDLPGFSKVINAILGAMRGEDDREFNMTKTVLSDPALTQKVLRLANSPMYSVFGRGINTVSKAVIVLGTEAIGHLALGLKLLDGLSAASSDSTNARSEMERALLAAHIARQVASTANMRDTEEAVVCSMLHTLGRMMVTVYLAGRAADQVLGDMGAHSGAAVDLDMATQMLARGYCQWGLYDALGHHGPGSAEVFDFIEKSIKRLLIRATRLVSRHRDAVTCLADALGERRLLRGEEVIDLIAPLIFLTGEPGRTTVPKAKARQRGLPKDGSTSRTRAVLK